MYSISNFIAPYAPTSKTVRILYPEGRVSFTLMVCHFQKASISNTTLNIVLEDSTREYQLPFGTLQEAKTALLLLTQAVDTLRPNCNNNTIGNTGGTITVNPIQITYLQYKNLCNANNLTAFQWYDVIDTTGIFFTAGTVMRMQPVISNDAHPGGLVLNATQPYVRLNVTNDKFAYYEDGKQSITLLNTDRLGSYDSTSTYIHGTNNSVVYALNSSYIEIDNDSTLNVSNCNHVKAVNNSNVVVNNAEDVEFDNIQQDLSTLPFVLQSVSIDRNTSIGKAINASSTISSNLNLYAYNDAVTQELNVSGSNSTYSILLYNLIPQANAEFKIKYISSGVGNTLKIKNFDNSQLFNITDVLKNYTVTFKYNKILNLFELSSIENEFGVKEIRFVPTVLNNQTNFVLPVPALTIDNLKMFLNGQKLALGIDFTYNSSTQTLTFVPVAYQLQDTDYVEILIS